MHRSISEKYSVASFEMKQLFNFSTLKKETDAGDKSSGRKLSSQDPVSFLPRKLTGSCDATRGVWPVGRGKFSFPSTLP